MTKSFPRIFETAALRYLDLPHRVWMAPMTRISAAEDGTPTPEMAEYYGRYARGGFAVLVTEGTYTDESYSMGYRNQPGLANESHLRGWSRVVDAVHAAGRPIFAQLMHAGGLVQYNRFQEKHIGPSAIRPRGEQLKMYGGAGVYDRTIEMTSLHLQEAVEGFGAAADRARRAGFDGIEIHGANGYLLDQFLTVYTNKRNDSYGRSLENRLRFVIEVIDAVQSAAGSDMLVGIRLSQSKVNDPDYRLPGGEKDAEQIFGEIGAAGVDYIHTCGHDALAPAFDGGSLPFSALAKRHGGVTVVANGGLHAPERAEQLLSDQGADFIALARGALANPDWPQRLQRGEPLQPFEPDMLMPMPTLENVRRWRERHSQATG